MDSEGLHGSAVMGAGRGSAAGTLWSMSSSAFTLVAVAEEHTRELPMSPYAFGALAMVAFLALLAILWFFRGVAAKVATGHGTHGTTGHQDAHADHQGSHH